MEKITEVFRVRRGQSGARYSELSSVTTTSPTTMRKDPAETWATPGRPPIADPYGHPLTFGSVLAAHDTLVAHASCGPTISGYGSDGDDFDGASCPCQWHGALIEEIADARRMVQSWPGYICGVCWAASCECGYVFESPAHASGRDRNHRFVCHTPACLLRRNLHLA